MSELGTPGRDDDEAGRPRTDDSHPPTVPISVVPISAVPITAVSITKVPPRAPADAVTGPVQLGKPPTAHDGPPAAPRPVVTPVGPPTAPFPQVPPPAAPFAPSSGPVVPYAGSPGSGQQPVTWGPGPHAGWGGRTPLQTDQRPVNAVVVVIAWLCAAFSVGYMLPWAIAASRGRSNQAAIGLLNLFLGWSFIGWVVSLVMACQAHAVRVVAPVNIMLATQVVAQPAVAPAGWYPSPTGVGREYWDGRGWTGHRAP